MIALLNFTKYVTSFRFKNYLGGKENFVSGEDINFMNSNRGFQYIIRRNVFSHTIQQRKTSLAIRKSRKIIWNTFATWRERDRNTAH